MGVCLGELNDWPAVKIKSDGLKLVNLDQYAGTEVKISPFVQFSLKGEPELVWNFYSILKKDGEKKGLPFLEWGCEREFNPSFLKLLLEEVDTLSMREHCDNIAKYLVAYCEISATIVNTPENGLEFHIQLLGSNLQVVHNWTFQPELKAS